MTKKNALFDEWPEKYDRWFTTPIGSLVKKYESELILDLLKPVSGETILDAGCGTGVFTLDILSAGTRIVGLDISFPMLRRAREKAGGYAFSPVLGDIDYGHRIHIRREKRRSRAVSCDEKRWGHCCSEPEQPEPLGDTQNGSGKKRRFHIPEGTFSIPR
jgi:SAM-dependent methyltransferase